MKKTGMIVVFGIAGLLQACAQQSPEQQRQVECVGATAAGAVVGAAIGNQFGSGSGKDIMTAGGAVAGGAAAQSATGC